MIIMGIDPGFAKLGYGIIKVKGQKLKVKSKAENLGVIDYGYITSEPNLSAGERLKKINTELNKLIKKHKPNLISVENIYFFKNLKTAMPVSQAKGVILFTAAKKKIPVCEFTPLQMKMAIVGYGKADKKQIQKMIEKMLKLDEPIKSDDAADALGVAICGALKNFS